MACVLLLLRFPISASRRHLPSRSSSPLAPRNLPPVHRGPRVSRHLPAPPPRALPDIAAAAAGVRGAVTDAFLANPPTWSSAALTNLVIFVAGSPLLLSGLSASGFVAAYLLGTLTWRAFGPQGFLVVVAYFVVGTAVTKLKIKQKEAVGVAEKRGGRRGPASVIGSSAAGCVCALLLIYNVGGAALAQLWRLGFVASFCTKLSDTVSSEIGKAYGEITFLLGWHAQINAKRQLTWSTVGTLSALRAWLIRLATRGWLLLPYHQKSSLSISHIIRYLVTTFKVVPRGTEGAISIEGTLAGILASIFLAGVGYTVGQVNISQGVMCVFASQIANYGESFIGATLQDKEGFEWLNNDVVNVLNISAGGILAVVMQQLLVTWRS